MSKSKNPILYTAYMPMGRDHKLVHLQSFDQRVTYRFISFEQHSASYSVRPKTNRNNIIRFTADSLDEKTIKELLSQVEHCKPQQIEIENNF